MNSEESEALQEGTPGEPSDWFTRLAQFMEKPRRPADSQSLELGESFLGEAKKDLREFRKKYDARDYAHATFWLQQSTEKATKGFMLKFGFLPESAMQSKVGHLTPLAFLEMIE